MGKRFKWVVEFEVDETWVEDGFDLSTDERAMSMLAEALPHATGSELRAKTIKSPTAKRIAKAQGYPTVKAYREELKR